MTDASLPPHQHVGAALAPRPRREQRARSGGKRTDEAIHDFHGHDPKQGQRHVTGVQQCRGRKEER